MARDLLQGPADCGQDEDDAKHLGGAITERAFFSWKNGQAHGPDGLPEAAAELPSRYRMPYPVNAA